MRMQYDWEHLPVPAPEEVLQQAKLTPHFFPAPEQITEDWILLSQQYQALFSLYFLNKTGLDRLEPRMAEKGLAPAGQEQQDFYQRNSCLGLRYFCFWTMPRAERLTEEEVRTLREIVRSSDAEERAEAWIAATFPRIMPVSPDEPDAVFIPRAGYVVERMVKGAELPLLLRCVPAAPEGSDWIEAENNRLKLLLRIGEQLNAALTRDLGFPVRTSIAAMA